MSNTVVMDCPRCGVLNTTMEVSGYTPTKRTGIWEFLGLCRSCLNASCVQGELVPLQQWVIDADKFNSSTKDAYAYIIGKAKDYLKTERVNLLTIFKNMEFHPVLKNIHPSPEHLPSQIQELFEEASKCLSIGCYNAAGAMFRLCLDITTKDIINKNLDKSPTAENKKTIHKRLEWIFDQGILPRSLEELSRCIKDDGNDAAHDGNIGQDEAEDLLDFTEILLERIYTEPENIRIAQERRQQRRQA